MKCPNCENKKYKKLRKFYLESVIAYWCTQCGTIYGPTHDYGKVIPNLSRWRKFKDEPPPENNNEPFQLERDKDSTLWWRPIGPLPKTEES